MRRASTAALVLLAATLALGCGSSESKQAQREDEDRQQIEAVATQFDAAIAGKDAKAFCKLLAPEDKERLTHEDRSCLVVWGPDQNALFKAKNPDLTIAKITKLDPPIATAKLANGGHLAFLREQGTWYVHLAPAKK